MINSYYPTGLPNGGVLANDVDVRRANMLIHQLTRTSTAGLCITNHAAQFFPSVFSETNPKIK